MKFYKTLSAFVLGLGLAASGCQQAAEAPAKVMTEDQKAIYSFGVMVGQQVGKQTKQIRLTPEELEAFKSGFNDALAGNTPAIEIEQYEEKFQTLARSRLEAGTAETKEKGAAFLAQAAEEPGAVKTDSGLVFKTISAGTGAHPQATDTVRVHYQGTLTDGKVFDSSIERGTPAEFALNRVIPCWTEGVQRMQVGEKAKLVCPASMAYGDRGAGADIPPGATLVFEVELLGIQGKK
jgi:FKBP-type peptidyl-prolyl cis-trans isomerase FkpA